MRGEVTKDASPGRARHALIAGQVGASALLLICAAIFLRSAFAAATMDPGLRTSDTVDLSKYTEPRRAALLQAVRAHPLVAAVAASSRATRAVVEMSTFAESATDKPPETLSRVPVDQLAVSPEYFDVLGINVVSGRNFTQAERTTDAGVVVVSETIARRLWPNRSAVGQLVRLHVPPSASPGGPALPSRPLMVVGVVRDPGRDFGWSIMVTFRGVYLPTSPESPGTSLTLRVHGDPEQARQALLEHLRRVDPVVQIMTLRSGAGLTTYMLRIAFWVTVVLAGLALVLTVSGLFSVLSYVVEQRAKEIGVRMALGATTRNVARLVLSQSLRPVGIGLVAGGCLAAALAIVLMSTPDAAEMSFWVDVFDPVAYGASLLIIVTAGLFATAVPALRAARMDPIATLRKD